MYKGGSFPLQIVFYIPNMPEFCLHVCCVSELVHIWEDSISLSKLAAGVKSSLMLIYCNMEGLRLGLIL